MKAQPVNRERRRFLKTSLSLPGDIERNLAILKGDLKFTNEDHLLLADFAGKAYDSEQIKKMPVV